MAELKQLEHFLLRYVPDILKQEFANIGLVMYEPVTNEFAEVRFTRDWGHVLYLDPQADVEMLAALERDIRQQLKDPSTRERYLQKIEESFSSIIQLSPKQVYLAEEPAKELDKLARFYFETLRFAVSRELAGRQKLKSRMLVDFERVGIGELVRELPLAVHAKYGFKFDFGYRLGTTIKLFQAMSLTRNMDQGVRILAHYPKIAGRIAQDMQLQSFLTAVVEDDLDRSSVETQFMLGALEEKSIRIAAAAEMPLIAEQARKELRA